MNQRVVDEANAIVKLPDGIFDWSIVDIGEGHRTDTGNRKSYEDEIYQEITQKVNNLLEEWPKNI